MKAATPFEIWSNKWVFEMTGIEFTLKISEYRRLYEQV